MKTKFLQLHVCQIYKRIRKSENLTIYSWMADEIFNINIQIRTISSTYKIPSMLLWLKY